WKVDCAIAGSQKGFMLPAGLGLICISPKALKIAEGGAGAEHIVRMTWYVTSRDEYLAGLAEIGAAYRELIGR
ncbi:hypothetical protein, partial [Acinetobacter baumannii]|uniref:hypothetical protein n=1 Tax=Acinetobacter baumannii TaxID=470 RepID=UPI0020902E7F